MSTDQLANYLFDLALLLIATTLVAGVCCLPLPLPVSIFLVVLAVFLVFVAQHDTYALGIVAGRGMDEDNDEEDEEPQS